MIPMGKVLFRAKDKNNQWVYGYPVFDWADCSLHCHGQHQGKLITFFAWVDECHEYDEVDVDPDTVCMYVWMEDKNGTPIFTGDIVERAYNRSVLVNGRPSIKLELFKGTVTWSDRPAGILGRWVLEGEDKKIGSPVQMPLAFRGPNICTVIGSIYD